MLAPAVASLPVFALLALPLLLDAASVWPWVADPGVMTRAVVAQWYLNLSGFVLRGAVRWRAGRSSACCWSAAARDGPRSPRRR